MHSVLVFLKYRLTEIIIISCEYLHGDCNFASNQKCDFIYTYLFFCSSHPPILCLVMVVDRLQHPWVQVVERQILNAAITQSCHVASWFICCTADKCGLPPRLPPQYTHHPFTCKHTFKKLGKKYYGICITESIQVICYQTKGLGLPLIDYSYRCIGELE